MPPNSWFFLTAVPILGVYFYLFAKTFGLLSESERKRFIQQAGASRWAALVPLAGCLVIAFVPVFTLRLVLAVGVLAYAGWGTWIQHKRLRDLGFDPTFERRLLRLSALSALGITLFLLGWLTQ